jgi:hypothetical protein
LEVNERVVEGYGGLAAGRPQHRTQRKHP